MYVNYFLIKLGGEDMKKVKKKVVKIVKEYITNVKLESLKQENNTMEKN